MFRFALVLLTFLLMGGVWGQTTVFDENMYNGSGGSNGNSIFLHESNNRFNEDGLTFSGTGDMRNNTNSSGYIGASGTWNCMLNSSGETLIIDGINATTFTSLSLGFGIRKGTNTSDGSGLIVECSISGASGSFTPISWPTLPMGGGTAIWYNVTSTSSILNTITTLRFRTTDGVEYRLDDILLSGVLATGPTLTTSSTSLSGFSYVVGNGPSASQPFDLTGTNLNGTIDVELLAGTGYEISTDNLNF